MVGETTVNIGRDVAARIAGAAAGQGASRRDIVSALLKYAAGRMKPDSFPRVCVKYQEKRPGVGWHRLHVVMRRDEYDFFTDLRKLFKLSVSFIIAYAVEHYLDEMLNHTNGITDNYLYRNYAIIQIPVGDIMCWLLCWGIHPELAKYLPPAPA